MFTQNVPIVITSSADLVDSSNLHQYYDNKLSTNLYSINNSLGVFNANTEIDPFLNPNLVLPKIPRKKQKIKIKKSCSRNFEYAQLSKSKLRRFRSNLNYQISESMSRTMNWILEQDFGTNLERPNPVFNTAMPFEENKTLSQPELNRFEKKLCYTENMCSPAPNLTYQEILKPCLQNKKYNAEKNIGTKTLIHTLLSPKKNSIIGKKNIVILEMDKNSKANISNKGLTKTNSVAAENTAQSAHFMENYETKFKKMVSKYFLSSEKNIKILIKSLQDDCSNTLFSDFIATTCQAEQQIDLPVEEHFYKSAAKRAEHNLKILNETFTEYENLNELSYEANNFECNTETEFVIKKIICRLRLFFEEMKSAITIFKNNECAISKEIRIINNLAECALHKID